MGIPESLGPLPLQRVQAIDPTELEYIAFTNQQEVTHGMFRSIPEHERERYANQYVLSEVIGAGIKKLHKFLAASAEVPASNEKAFVDSIARLFIRTCRERNSYPRELFQSVLDWSDELTRLSLLQEALRLHDELIDCGVKRFPDLYIKTLLAKAAVLNTRGGFSDAQKILQSLASRPYAITDRNLITDILLNLGKESLLKGDITYYKQILFRGLRHFSTKIENRRSFVDQIRIAYRRSRSVLFDSKVSLNDRILFLLHHIYFVLERRRIFRHLQIVPLAKVVVLGYVYCTNYIFRVGADASVESNRSKQFLVTRAMGGIGDLLMMTPGFHALKKRHPECEIRLAIPQRYFPVFDGNPDVQVIDIEDESLDVLQYRRWYNFTDCPASRTESRTAPHVKKGRIEIFTRALGLSGWRVRRMEKRPRYFVLPEEKAFQTAFWRANGLEGKRVIGAQLRSDEAYRDYPHMRELILRLAEDYTILVFDAETIPGLDHPRIHKVENQPMRRAFALASGCDAIVAPDSSFVHLAAALQIPCVALYGPIDGRVRTRDYPECIALDVKAKLGCLPCWRNAQIPCKLTNMRASVCMSDIDFPTILNSLTSLLQRPRTQ
jgi:ADP-heptose:LPS heptosyltransferase